MIKLVCIVILSSFFLNLAVAFSVDNNKKFDDHPNEDGSPSLISRRNLWTLPIGIGGAFVYGKLVADSVEKLSRGDLVYPKEHETRVQETFRRSLSASILPVNKEVRPLRVLEVGIGSEWRVARRGLYQDAFKELASTGLVKDVQLTGVDIAIPSEKIAQEAERRMEDIAKKAQIDISTKILAGDITSKLNFADGWFDAVLCSLTLCSVADQEAALNEIFRLVRPNGGTFGYVEHVAVEMDEPYKLLEVQQQLFDPLQQLVADNCHLHRNTDSNIAERFSIQDRQQSSRIHHERFLVNGMWPVSCQCCGVIQKA